MLAADEKAESELKSAHDVELVGKPDLINDLFEEDEIDEMEEELEELRCRHESVVQSRVAARQSAEARSRQQRDGGGVVVSPSGILEVQYVRKPANGEGLSQPEAAVYLPPNASITKGCARDLYWQTRSPSMPVSRSKAYGGRRWTDWSAMVFCLQLAWRAHERCTGEKCPWQFEESGIPVVIPEDANGEGS